MIFEARYPPPAHICHCSRVWTHSSHRNLRFRWPLQVETKLNGLEAFMAAMPHFQYLMGTVLRYANTLNGTTDESSFKHLKGLRIALINSLDNTKAPQQPGMQST